jgi:predicted enzyme involved in methoxymalonyl-ACP biosynthesis
VVFLLSCRVLSRGIAGYFLAWVRSRAAAEGAQRLTAVYRPGPRNARMRTLYGLSGLSPVEERPGGIQIFAGPTAAASEPPHWLTVHEGGS